MQREIQTFRHLQELQTAKCSRRLRPFRKMPSGKFQSLLGGICVTCVLTSPFALADETVKDKGKAEKENIITVTATGSEHLFSTAPASISIISAEEIKLLPIKDIGDILKTIAGVTISNWVGGRNSIYLRGLDEDYVLILVNGKRVSSSNGLWRAGNFDNTSIPLELIERVEVVRGPMSALYGSDAVGGVVNIITRMPKTDWLTSINYQNSQMSEGDGGDRYRASIFTSGQLNEQLGMVFSAEKAHQTLWKDAQITPNSDTIEARETLKMATTLSWQINPEHSLELDLANDQDDVPITNYGGATREQTIDRLTYGITHNAEWQWGATKIIANQSVADIYDFNSRYSLQPPLGRDIEETFTTLRATGFFTYQQHNFTLGSEYLQTEVEDPVQYPTTGGDSLSLTSVFMQDEIDLTDALILTLGVRVEDSESYGTHTSPRAYLVYTLNDTITIKGGVGSAFRAPTLFESSALFSSVSCRGLCALSGNPDLQEETSLSSELSILVNQEQWEASLTVFNNEVKDLITVEGWDGIASSRTYYNEAQVEINGVEFFALTHLSETARIELNYTYMDTEDSSGKQLFYRPRHNANLKMDWQLLEDLNLYTQINYYGAHIGNQSQQLSAYTQVSLGATYQLNDNLRLNLGMTNLTNEQPVVDDPSSDMILQGRAIFAGFNYQLD